MPCAYLLKRFPRLSQTFVLEELLELQRQGHALTVLAARGPGGPTPTRARMLRAPLHYLPDDVPEAAAAPWVATQLRAAGAQHLHAHFAGWASEVAAAAAPDAGIGFSFTAHATDIYRHGLDEAALAARAEAARFVVTVTDANREHLERLLDRHGRSGRVVRVYNGVDCSRLRPSSGAREPGHVVAVGRLVPKKGFDVLVEAVALMRSRGTDVCVTVIGEGPERGRLETQVAAAGVQRSVRLVGERRHEQVLESIARSTLLALPCVVAEDGDRDALPTVVLEAMALGTPVVSTRVSGVPEMIEDGGSGLLVEQRDPVALALALEQLLADPHSRGRLAARAREVVTERFDLATNVATLRSLVSDASAVSQALR